MEGDNDEKEEKPRWRSRLTIKIGGQVSARPLAPRGRSAARAGVGSGRAVMQRGSEARTDTSGCRAGGPAGL